MKTTALLLIGFLLISLKGWSQYVWSDQTNPDYEPNFTSDASLFDGKLYHFTDSNGSQLEVSVFNPSNESWTTLDSILYVNTSINRIEAFFIGSTAFIIAGSISGYELFEFNTANNLITRLNGLNMPTSASNWNQTPSVSNDKIFLAHVSTTNEIYLSEYDIISDTWTATQNISSTINPTATNCELDYLPIYTNTNEVYVGKNGSSCLLGLANIGDFINFHVYNQAEGNDGYIYYAGNIGTAIKFTLIGDGFDAPFALVSSTATLKRTWEKSVGTTNINVIPGSDPFLPLNLGSKVDQISQPTFSYVLSNFSLDSSPTFDQFYIYRRDNGASTWDTIPLKAENGTPNFNSGNFFDLAIDNLNYHMVVQYASMGTVYQPKIRVLNHKVDLGTNRADMNGGLCSSNYNEIYPRYDLYDADLELVRIVGLHSINGTITSMNTSQFHYEIAGGLSVSKYQVNGILPSAAVQDTVVVEITDGWNYFIDTLPEILIPINSAPVVSFTPSTLTLCDNENLIELSNFVSYVDDGTFKLNGAILPSSSINGLELSTNSPFGSISYEVNIGGCYVQASAPYSFVQVGTASGSSTPTSCGNNTGTADINFTPGTSSTLTFEWTTGATTSTINGLAPGPYFYNVKDEYGCNVIGFTSVEASDIDVSAVVNNVTCAGGNNGSIALTVTNPANPLIVWSTGHSTPTLSNLSAGTYEVTIYDPTTGCHVSYAYTITEQNPIQVTFNNAEPSCGVSNGIIYGSYTGGSGSYTYNWLGTGQTNPNLVAVPYGFYEVKVTDGSGCIVTVGHQLDNYQAADIFGIIGATDCSQATGFINVNFSTDVNGGTLPLIYNWSTGASTEDLFGLIGGDYTITAQSGPSNNCFSQKTFTVGVAQPLLQQICIVTVDTNTTTNLVAWEKVEASGISHYNIYRENSVAGTFVLIDTVQYGSESVFNDVVASPEDRSWRYKISAVNECNIEGPISMAHKTMHLNSVENIGDGSYDIYWDDYEGLIEAEYVVWRYSTENNWEPLSPTVPFGISVYNDLPPAGLTNIDYCVDLSLSTQCTATLWKAQDFNNSRSNRRKSNYAPGIGTGASNNGINESVFDNATVILYPNPTTTQSITAYLDGIETADYTLFNLSGTKITTGKLSVGETKIDLNGVQSGTYLIELHVANESKMLRFVVQ